jgi:hypothetical protein
MWGLPGFQFSQLIFGLAMISTCQTMQLDRLHDKRLQVQAKAGWLRVQAEKSNASVRAHRRRKVLEAELWRRQVREIHFPGQVGTARHGEAAIEQQLLLARTDVLSEDDANSDTDHAAASVDRTQCRHCERTVSPGLHRDRSPYTTCCRGCGIAKGAAVRHDRECEDRHARMSVAAVEEDFRFACAATVSELVAEAQSLKQMAAGLDHGLTLLTQAHASIRQCSGSCNPEGYKMAWLVIKTMRQVGDLSAAAALSVEVEAAGEEWSKDTGRRLHRCARWWCLDGWAGIVIWPQSTTGASNWLMLAADCRCANGAPDLDVAEALVAAAAAGWGGEMLGRPALKGWSEQQ